MKNEMKLVENGIVPVYQNDKQEKLVDARELYEFLEVKSKFADWIKNRINKYGFIENMDFAAVSKILENGGKQIDYILKLDTAKEIAMVENNTQGRMARRYFIEIEKKFRKLAKPQSVEDLIIMQAQSMKQMREELQSAKEQISSANDQIGNIKGTIIDTTENWRTWVNKKLKAIGAKLGDYRSPRIESYEELKKRGRCDLDRRLGNLIVRLKNEGSPKRRINNACYLDAIEQDQRLKEIYTTIVKEMTIKYMD